MTGAGGGEERGAPTEGGQDTEGGDVQPRAGRSVRQQLALFTAALSAPILIFTAAILWQFAVGERTRLEADASDTARTVALAIDRDVTGLLASLDALSTSPFLQSGDIDGFYRQASELSQRQGIVPVLTDLEGRQLVNLRVPRGTALPATNQPFDKAELATGRPFVTDLFTGQLTGKPLFSVAEAVSRDGRPAYVLSFSLSVDRLLTILRETDIPSGYTVAIIDRAGRLMARSNRHDEFVGKLATPELRDAATGNGGTWTGPSLDGGEIFGAYSRSRQSGFRAAVAIGVADLNAPLIRSLSLFGALFAVVLALSSLLAFLFGARIIRPIRALAHAASAMGRGEPVPVLATGLFEANQVGAELASASAALRAREGELRDATDEIQRFAYIVSHDLRSPLVNIMGFTTELEALREDVFRRLADARAPDTPVAERNHDRQLGEDFDEAVTFIKTSIGKMDRLINAILRLSREGRREFHPERIDMDAMADGIAKSLAHQAELAGATVSATRLPAMRSDRVAIEQIFTNLVDNALKYLRAGVPGRVELSGRATRSTLVYEVRDNGRGIDPKDAERVFELFRRSGPQDRPGEGIGLAHVRALVRRLGGTITLTSALGQGSTFTVVLPRRWTGEGQGKAS